MARAKALVAGIVSMLALVGVVSAASTTPSVTITSPKANSTLSVRQTKRLNVAGTAAFTPVTAGSARFYLRRDGCGGKDKQGNAVADNPHLSVAPVPAGTIDGGEGCGFVGGNGFVSTASKGLFSVDYPSTDGMPLILDTSRTIEGTLDLQNDTAGVGQVTLDFTVEALVNGEGVIVGTDTETVMVDPTTSDYFVPFHITPNASLEKVSLSGVDLNVYPHGAYSDSAYLGNSGKSFMTIPSFSASPDRAVQVSLDDPSFGSPVAATLNSSSTGFSTTLPTPAIGKHTLYARATQGYATSPVASSTFTIKK